MLIMILIDDDATIRNCIWRLSSHHDQFMIQLRSLMYYSYNKLIFLKGNIIWLMWFSIWYCNNIPLDINGNLLFLIWCCFLASIVKEYQGFFNTGKQRMHCMCRLIRENVQPAMRNITKQSSFWAFICYLLSIDFCHGFHWQLF